MRVQMSKRLFLAVHDGDLESCKHLVQRGVDVDMVDQCGGCTPFIRSYVLGKFDLAMLFLLCGANYDRTTCDSEVPRGYTAAHFAACYGNLDILKFLPVKITSWSRLGVKPFHLAAANGHLECLKFLLNHGNPTSNTRESLNLGINDECDTHEGWVYLKDLLKAIPASLGVTALHLASAQGRVDVVAFLLIEGAQTAKTDQTGKTALHYAAGRGCIDIIDILLEKDVFLESADKGGYTPLHYAVLRGQVETAKRLLGAGANVHSRNYIGQTLLHSATRCGFTDIVDILQEYDIDVTVKDVDGSLALHEAIDLPKVAIFKRLFSKETDLEAFDIKGRSLLLYMMDYGPKDMEVVTMECFPSHDVPRNSRFGTLLNIACVSGHLYFV